MPDDVMAYWKCEGLDQLVSLYQDPDSADPFHATSGKGTTAFAPQVPDLVQLHRLVRDRMAATILEFGVGFSTVVLADALSKNEVDFNAVPNRLKLRNSRLFQLFGVDASRHWIAETRKRIPKALAKRVAITYSPVEIGTHNGQLCHF